MINDLDIVSFTFIMLSMAEFSIQIVVSELSTKVKDWFWLSQPYNKKLQTLSFCSFWRKLLKHGWLFALPLIVAIKAHKLISELLACPWCTAFHLSWITSYLYLQQDIITSLLLAPVTLVFVTILDRIHTHG